VLWPIWFAGSVGQVPVPLLAAACHERRVQDMAGVMKGAFRTLNALNAPFMTCAMS